MHHSIRRRRTITGIVAVITAAFFMQGTAVTPASAAPARHPGMGAVHVARLSVGHVLVDAKGRTLYVFSADKHHKLACNGACASVWPPLLARRTVALKGVKKKWLGTVKAADGARQVTYRHWPLYTYVGDTKRGEATGQGLSEFGGKWSTIGAKGRPHFGKAAATSKSPSGSGYGYGIDEPASKSSSTSAGTGSSSGSRGGW